MANIVIKKHSAVLSEGLEYIIKRASGEVKSLKTGWTEFDQIGFGGMEWGTLMIISSRPGVGKTLLVQSLSRNLQHFNQDQDFNVLNFQFEMLSKNIAAREFAGISKKSLRYLLSAGDKGLNKLSGTDIQLLKAYAETLQHRNEYVVDTALSSFEMRQVIDRFYQQHHKPFVITLDHTLLVKQSSNEKSELEKLQNLSTMMVETKNAYPISWIVLSQLNRSIDDPDRQVPGKLSNYPNPSDIFGSKKLDQ